MKPATARSLVLGGMILFAAGMKLLPYVLALLGVPTLNADGIPDPARYPWNFSPVAAICLFGGARFAHRIWAYAVPAAAMVLSDIGIGLLMGEVRYTFYPEMASVYACFALTVWIGSLLKQSKSLAAIAASALVSEVIFFVVTNFFMWLLSKDIYSRDLAGLADCYVMAIPFFRFSLMGMAIYATVLFGGLELAERSFPFLRQPAYAPAR